MTTSQDPDEIRAEIEQTRAAVSDDVNRLADTANPKNVARRQVEKVKGAAADLKDRVMASDDSDYSSSSAADTLRDKAASTREAVGQAPGKVKSKTRGNPLAAGVIAFGAGMLVSSLIPSSRAEQRAVSQLQENIEPVKQEAAGIARDMAQNLKEPARDAAQSVKGAATDAADTVRSEGASAAQDVRDQVQDSKETVQQTRQS
jgi:ElaB/YqjD/DUF883 family membrane-anchored ribosome-binding protein